MKKYFLLGNKEIRKDYTDNFLSIYDFVLFLFLSYIHVKVFSSCLLSVLRVVVVGFRK